MADEYFRQNVIRRIDQLLGKWLIGGEDRTLLTALRGYVSTMSEADIDRFKSYMPVHGGRPPRADEYPQELKDAALEVLQGAADYVLRAQKVYDLVSAQPSPEKKENDPMPKKQPASHGALIALPTDPMAGIDTMIEYYKDPSNVELGELGHAALHVVAYGYGQFHGDGVEGAKAGEAKLSAGKVTCPPDDPDDPCPDCCDDEECLALLEKAKAAHEGKGVAKGGKKGAKAEAVPWALLIQLAVQILMKLLVKDNGPA